MSYYPPPAQQWAQQPSFPYPAPVAAPSPSASSPFPTPPLVFLILIAFAGYHILRRQESARDRSKVLAKEAAKAAKVDAAEIKALSSKDVRAGGLPSSGAVGNPAPKQISGKGGDPRKDPSSTSFRKNYFMTMQGPGRPALVPFQDGLRPKRGEAEGTMWWDNVPEDVKDLMAAPLDPDKLKAMMKNPWNEAMLKKDIELLKLKKQHKEEQERFEKVGNVLHALLSGLLCLVDMRLGIASFTFFLWRYFTAAHKTELEDKKDEVEKEKAEIMKRISEARKAAPDSSAANSIQRLQADLMRL